MDCKLHFYNSWQIKNSFNLYTYLIKFNILYNFLI